MAVMRSLALIGLALLAGCGANTRTTVQEGVDVRALAISRVTSIIRRDTPPDIRTNLTRQAIDDFGGPLMLIVREDTDVAATFVPIAQDGDVTVWQTPSGQQVTLRDGVVVTTRAFGGDIASSDVASVLPRLRTGNGAAVRVPYFTSPEGKPATRSITCTYARKGGTPRDIFGLRVGIARVIVESCWTPQTRFENTYHYDSRGVLWASRQWVSPEVGMVSLTRLHR